MARNYEKKTNYERELELKQARVDIWDNRHIVDKEPYEYDARYSRKIQSWDFD
ncbi:MAG TPA: hypothetical protein V6C58_08620 [Allocoleopsis sp.]